MLDYITSLIERDYNTISDFVSRITPENTLDALTNAFQYICMNFTVVFAVFGIFNFLVGIINIVFGFKKYFYVEYFNKYSRTETEKRRKIYAFVGISEILIGLAWFHFSNLFR